MRSDFASYAEDISEFLVLPRAEVEERLSKGFFWNHAEVAADFRRVAPQNDEELLDFYLNTTSYLYAELPTYHMDPGWNYMGGVAGYVGRVVAEGKKDVLVMGDGIGDLTMELHSAGLNAHYNDLEGSRTAEFAQYRFWKAFGNQPPPCYWTTGWTFDFGYREWDAIIATDVFEHLVDVEGAARSVARGLRMGGLFAAQNAFACGSGDEGSIPLHLAKNDRFEQDWLPLLAEIGFEQVGDVWHQKVASSA